MDDEGNSIGLSNAKEECLRIENIINDTIDPVPDFRLNTEDKNGKTIIVLFIKKGKDTPYSYKGKAYKRADTSTVEVDRTELRRLALEGSNIDFEQARASSQNLNFTILGNKLKEKAGIKTIHLDILKTLNLYSIEGFYTIAGELLADENNIKFSGIDIVRFGKDINQILYRETVEHQSLLSQYDRAVEIYEQYYQYEEIEGYKRMRKELIPKEAFREGLANAIIHRVWDTNSYVRVSMYNEKIEISSPGGLPKGISKEEYLYGNVSILRNPIIAGVFYRLDLIEQFGTGIARINMEYKDSLSKPNFHIGENSIKIVLPVINPDGLGLSDDEIEICNRLKNETELSRKELDETSGFDKSKTVRTLNSLIEKNIIEKLGQGPATTYRLK
jgi:ATP-dependent DNA helicase RecG